MDTMNEKRKHLKDGVPLPIRAEFSRADLSAYDEGQSDAQFL